MTAIRTRLAAALPRAFFCLVLLALSQAAFAQATRTWVSGVGDDANPCSRTAPCRTWAGALPKTAAGGEIDALDAGGFGAATITKSITLNGYDIGSILSAGTHAIVVSAGPTDVVRLRNLTINGHNTGLDGVRFVSGAALHLDNVHVISVTGFGVNFIPTTAGAKLYVTRSTFVDNRGVSGGGVQVAPVAGAFAMIDGNQFTNNEGMALRVAGSAAIVHIHGNLFAGNRMGLQTANDGKVMSSLGNRFAGNLGDAWPTGHSVIR